MIAFGLGANQSKNLLNNCKQGLNHVGRHIIIQLAFLSLLAISSLTAFASSDITVYPSEGGLKRGQVLVVHGLNTNPHKMNDIIREFNNWGIDAFLLTLKGHGNSKSEMESVSFEIWQKQFLNAYKLMVKSNEINGGKLYFSGYSLGGALGMAVIGSNSSVMFEHAFLFAPALVLNASSYFIKATYLLNDGVSIPSFSPEEFKAQRGTTVSAYKALFDTVEKFEKGELYFMNFPLTIFIDKEDELVSYKKMIDYTDYMSHWKLIQVDNKGSRLEKPYNHLIISKRALGEKEWFNKVTKELSKILRKN